MENETVENITVDENNTMEEIETQEISEEDKENLKGDE